MIIALSFDRRVLSCFIEKKNRHCDLLSPDYRFFCNSNYATYLHGEHTISLFDYVCFIRKKCMKILLLMVWFTEGETEYRIKMLKRKNSYCQCQHCSKVIQMFIFLFLALELYFYRNSDCRNLV